MTFVARVFAAIIFVGLVGASPARSETMTLSLSSSDFVLNPIFSDVDFFTIDVEIDRPLAPGLYVNPPIIDVAYQVRGTLAPGVPSGLRTLNLQRYMTGAEFYAQGSSLRFEISQNAVLIDGIQVAELTGNSAVLTFNGREINTGRYDPPQLVLNSNGTGQIQNSNNIPGVDPLVTVNFGEEYITNLLFDPGNTTVITATSGGVIDDDDDSGFLCAYSSTLTGTWLEPELKRLRNFRDKFLLRSELGRHFVNWYYRISPPVAAAIAEHVALRVLALMVLTPPIYAIKYPILLALCVLSLLWWVGYRCVHCAAGSYAACSITNLICLRSRVRHYRNFAAMAVTDTD